MLATLRPEHAEAFLDHMNRGREFIAQHIALADIITDLDSSRAYLQSYVEKLSSDTGRIYGIWLHETLVGGVLFPKMDSKMGNAEAGCWLEQAAAGQGIATVASRLIIDWVFRGRGFHRVEWLVSSENTPSIAVAKRLGMQRDGVLREAYLLRGQRHDLEVWSVLAPEWRLL